MAALLDTERRNEIAFLVLTEYIKKQGIPTLNKGNLQKELFKEAEILGLDKVTMLDFARQVYLPLLMGVFYDKSIFGEGSDPVIPVIMNEKQRNMIAFKSLVHLLKKRGFPSLKKNEFRRDILNQASTIGVGEREIMVFARETFTSVINDLFHD